MTDDRQRAVGKLISVSADRLVVELHRISENFTVNGFDDIHYVARLGNFILLPLQSEYVVAEVVGLREKDTASPREQHMRDSHLDKAYSAKYLDLVPVGTLPQKRDGVFRFGVSTFPTLYADALYAMDHELDRIFDVSDFEAPISSCGDPPPTKLVTLRVGTSSVFKGYGVRVRVNEFFSGHVSVLGNTGSGKSCTVASIFQSLFNKSTDYAALGASVLFLDVNGEYRSAFAGLGTQVTRHYLTLSSSTIDTPPAPLDANERTSLFRIPHWFMSVEEWELLLRASERTQQPVLRTALGLTSLFSPEFDDTDEFEELRTHILASCIRTILQSDNTTTTKADRIISIISTFETDALPSAVVTPLCIISYGSFARLDELLELLETCILDNVSMPNYRNLRFSFEHLGSTLELAILYEESHGNRQIRDYCSQLLTRYKWIKERDDFSFLRVSLESIAPHEESVRSFVNYIIGVDERNGKSRKTAQLTLLDLNDAGDEVIEIAAAVIARLIFERLRTADPRNRLPVHLILEEAHRYVAQNPSKHAIDAGRVFQRVAKEGRKYGLMLLLASQRPSELSNTVLSQCSNYIIHRIQNPDDLQHIRQMTPFISENVLRRLPSLPKQHALIFGNSVNLPTTFRVRDVSPKPKSDDADIGSLWFIPDLHELPLSPVTSTAQNASTQDQLQDEDSDYSN